MTHQSCTHTPPPIALRGLDLFDLRNGLAQSLAPHLPHLQIEQRRHDRHQWQNENVNQPGQLVCNLKGDARVRVLGTPGQIAD